MGCSYPACSAKGFSGSHRTFRQARFAKACAVTTEEGRIAVTGNGNAHTPNYYRKDHLGNVRAVINKEGTILQETEYFPFGMAVPKTGNDAVNKYQFLNRKKHPETGYMDLMRRFYDPTIGRFIQVDPVTETQENYSTYQYGWNNPILRNDPNGDIPIWGFIIRAGVDYGFQVAINLA